MVFGLDDNFTTIGGVQRHFATYNVSFVQSGFAFPTFSPAQDPLVIFRPAETSPWCPLPKFRLVRWLLAQDCADTVGTTREDTRMSSTKLEASIQVQLLFIGAKLKIVVIIVIGTYLLVAMSRVGHHSFYEKSINNLS